TNSVFLIENSVSVGSARRHFLKQFHHNVSARRTQPSPSYLFSTKKWKMSLAAASSPLISGKREKSATQGKSTSSYVAVLTAKLSQQHSILTKSAVKL